MSSSKTALTFIFVTILVDVIGIGIIIPVVPSLIENLTGEGLSVAAKYGGYLMVAFAGMQFLFAPIMGELSDKYGRRPILLIALFGLGVDYVFHAVAPTIGWLFVGRILAGICGASFTVANAYIADVSTKENKAKNFGLVGAAFGLGFIIGPVIGGIAAKWGVQTPFLVAAGLTLLNFLFGLLFVPESLPKEKRRPINFKKMIPGKSLLQLGTFAALGGLLFAFFLASLAGQSLPATWSYFTMEMFDWTEAEVGYSLGVVGLLVAIVQAGLVGKIVKKFGTKKTILGGFVLWSIGMGLYAVAVKGWMLYLFTIPYVLGGIAGPTLQGLMSNQVEDNEQGILQGTITSMTSITTILGPLISTGLFYYFTGKNQIFYFPGAPYAMGAVFLITACFFAYFALKKIPRV